MITFLVAPPNLPFSVSIGLMLFIALIEGVGAVLGFGVSDFLDSLLPDMDFDMDAPDIDTPSGFTKLLGWLRIGTVPVMVLLIIFLTAFGITGLLIQTAAESISGVYLPGMLASVAALIVSIPIVRLLGGVTAKVMPQDETDAVSESSLVGRVAIIVIGRATKGSPAQAKLSDQHGTTHYIMVEPDVDGDVFETGTHVLIVSHAGAVYKGIVATNPALIK